jgi:mono/diheme cytochrome c family protein
MSAAETAPETAPETPQTRRKPRRRYLIWLLLILLIGVGLAVGYQLLARSVPVTYDDPEEHFKYGSIGSEPVSGLPYWIWKALPLMFADKLPEGARDYRAFGLLYEPGKDLPIGVSQRKVMGIDRVWLNCAVCHVGTVRAESGAEQQLILGAPSNNLRLFDFIQFLRAAAIDNRWQPDYVLAKIEEAGGDLGLFERLIYRFLVVGQVRKGLLAVNDQLEFLDRQLALGHDWGPGRVDTFNPYKKIQFNYDMSRIPDAELTGAADYPSIWMQRPRQGMNLHWDGNNASVEERNLSASLGAGVTPTTIDMASLERIRNWLWDFPSPKFPRERIDSAQAARGAPLYARYCAACHGAPKADGNGYDYDRARHPRLGEVEPLAEIGTDPGRWRSYTQAFAGEQNMLFAGYPLPSQDCESRLCAARFHRFKKTAGYANHPLDGIWARSPYLHNGSVPTLRDLLEPADARPVTFYRGSDVFDWDGVGYVSAAPKDGEAFFLVDTRVPGNSNAGHEGPAYGTGLSATEKDAIVEYMKTF